MLKQVKFIGICVADQERARRFYQDVLGCEVLTDQPFDEKQRWIEMKIPNADTGFALFTPPGEENRIGTNIHTSILVDDIDAAFNHLRSHEVECLGEPQKEDWGSFLQFKDSEGNTLLLSAQK